MSEKIVLITGANGRLGRAIARAFLTGSAEPFVCLGVHRERGEAEAVAREFPNRAEVRALDVTSAGDWERAIDGIIGRHGRLDVLVNNAGGHDDALLGQMSGEQWSSVVSLNLDSVFRGCRSVLDQMISQRSGRIVNIASLSALLAPAGQTNYAAAKAGVVAMTRSFAKEVARIGITVNAVCPGYIESEATERMEETARKHALQWVPMRRFGRPEEVASLVHFLAGSEAAYITGAAIKIDGGIL